MGRKRDDDFWQGTDRRDYEEPPEDYYLDEPDDGYWDDEGPDSSIPDETLSVIHQYIEGTYTIFPERKKEAEITGNARQLSLFDFMDAGTGEPEAHENTEPAGKTEKEETEVRYPEAEPEAEETAHSEPELPQEKPDSAHYEEIDGQVSEAVEVSGTAFDEYSPEQMERSLGDGC